jgi:hypothetical protein
MKGKKMEKKRPLGLKNITSCGCVFGALLFFFGCIPNNYIFLILGSIILLLNIGLYYLLWNWIRIVFVLFYLVLSLLCIVTLVDIHNTEGSIAMRVALLASLLLFFLGSAIYLTRPKVREQFK